MFILHLGDQPNKEFLHKTCFAKSNHSLRVLGWWLNFMKILLKMDP